MHSVLLLVSARPQQFLAAAFGLRDGRLTAALLAIEIVPKITVALCAATGLAGLGWMIDVR
jgi:hypothetical protein